MERTRDQAREQGYVETLFGRRLYLPDIRASNMQRRQGAERAAINAPMQGTAADIIKRAMIAMPAALLDAGLSARMLLQVHDELVFDVPEGKAEKPERRGDLESSERAEQAGLRLQDGLLHGKAMMAIDACALHGPHID